MKREHRLLDGTLFCIDDAEPECGEDFCAHCGDCLSCYGGHRCYGEHEDDEKRPNHRWIEYHDDDDGGSIIFATPGEAFDLESEGDDDDGREAVTP